MKGGFSLQRDANQPEVWFWSEPCSNKSGILGMESDMLKAASIPLSSKLTSSNQCRRSPRKWNETPHVAVSMSSIETLRGTIANNTINKTSHEWRHSCVLTVKVLCGEKTCDSFFLDSAVKRHERKKFQSKDQCALAAFQMNYVCDALRSFAVSFCSAISLRSLQTASQKENMHTLVFCCDSWYTSTLMRAFILPRQESARVGIHSRCKKLFSEKIKAWSGLSLFTLHIYTRPVSTQFFAGDGSTRRKINFHYLWNSVLEESRARSN